MRVALIETALDPWQAVQTHQRCLTPGSYGATALFVGTMRDFNEGSGVSELFLEHYPGMTERHLVQVAEEAQARWTLIDVLIEHRVGTVYPDDPIVVTAAWSAHRKDAFEACRFLMEALKSRAPFWKRETTEQGSRWVERNTAGY